MMRTWHRYAPSILVLAAAVCVLFAGPALVDRLLYAHEKATTQLARQELASTPFLAQLNNSIENVARAVEPSVVHITVSRTNGETLFSERQGSGWVYDDQGHIVTNYHVIENADRIEARFSDGLPHRATLVGGDPDTDIAVILVESRRVVPIARATGYEVSQGDMVFAFGSPFGFEFAMSSGIVSGKGRQPDINRQGYENYIQTDAAINPGNSGGPLVNIYGQLVGMNMAIAIDPQDPVRGGRFTGVGLAIPLDIIEFVVSQLLSGEPVRRAGLGANLIDAQRVPPDELAALKLPTTGAVVQTVFPDTPAQRAGLQPGDLITQVDGRPVGNASTFRTLIHNVAPGTVARFHIWRTPDWLDLDVTLGDWTTIDARMRLRDFGCEARELSETDRRALNIHSGFGVWIESVDVGSQASAMGVPEHIAVTHASGQPVRTLNDLVVFLESLRSGRAATITAINESGVTEKLDLKLPTR